jgi:hypothetical protein
VSAVGVATSASLIDNSIIRRHAVMTFDYCSANQAPVYKAIRIGVKLTQMIGFSEPYENIYEDTTSDHTDRNGIVIDTFDGPTIYSIPISRVHRREGTWEQRAYRYFARRSVNNIIPQ